MRILYHCDYCHNHNIDPNLIIEHEKECKKSLAIKTCDSCKHKIINRLRFDEDFCELDWHIKIKFIENCKDWKINDNQMLRKFKLEKLNENR